MPIIPYGCTAGSLRRHLNDNQLSYRVLYRVPLWANRRAGHASYHYGSAIKFVYTLHCRGRCARLDAMPICCAYTWETEYTSYANAEKRERFGLVWSLFMHKDIDQSMGKGKEPLGNTYLHTDLYTYPCHTHSHIRALVIIEYVSFIVLPR